MRDRIVDSSLLSVSTFHSTDDNVPQLRSTTWDQFVRSLLSHRTLEHKGGALWSPAIYPEGATRAKESVTQVGVAAFDLDDGTDAETIGYWLGDLEHVITSTHSHTPEHPKLRVVIRLSQPIPNADFDEAWRCINQHLLHGRVDPATKDSSRMFYVPSRPRGAEVVAVHHEGKPLDWRALPPLPKPKPLPKRTKVDRNLSDDQRRAGHLLAKWENELAAMPSGGRHNRLLELARAAGGLISSGLLDEHDTRERLLAACQTNGLIGDDGEHNVLRTLSDGFEHGGAAPWIPDDLPDSPAWQVNHRFERRNGAGLVDLQTGEAIAQLGPEHGNGHTPHPISLQEIVCNNRQLPDVTRDALAALVDANSPPSIFQRGKEMVRVVESAEKRPLIQPLGEPALRGEIARAARWVNVSIKGNVSSCSPPMDVVRDIWSLRAWPEEIPPLADIIEAPALRPDGSIILDAGYDRATGVFYMPRQGLQVPAIPVSPTERDINDALCVINDIIGEFPFDGPASWANALALMLTPLIRACLETSPAPLALLDAPQQGSGKSLFARVVSIIATGQEAAAFTAPTEEAEWRKAVTSIVRAGAPFVLIDNVDLADWHGNPLPLRSAALSAILTTSVHRDRVLGTPQLVDIPTRATWAVSGNNLQVGGDLIRRCYRCRLDAKSSRPWLGRDFTHPELVDYVKQQRGQVLCALLTLCRGWFARGKPVASTPVIGSFEPWSRTIGGILMVAGVDGFLGDLVQLYESSDTETPEWEAFLQTWSAEYDTNWLTVADLDSGIQDNERSLKESLPSDLAGRTSQDGFRKSLGKALAKKLGVRHGSNDLRLDSRDDPHSKVKQWRVLRGA